MRNKHVIITFTQIQFTIAFATVFEIVRNCIATVANALAAKLAGLQRQPIELPVRWVFFGFREQPAEALARQISC